jgi:hypothetical protein
LRWDVTDACSLTAEGIGCRQHVCGTFSRGSIACLGEVTSARGGSAYGLGRGKGILWTDCRDPITHIGNITIAICRTTNGLGRGEGILWAGCCEAITHIGNITAPHSRFSADRIHFYKTILWAAFAHTVTQLCNITDTDGFSTQCVLDYNGIGGTINAISGTELSCVAYITDRSTHFGVCFVAVSGTFGRGSVARLGEVTRPRDGPTHGVSGPGFKNALARDTRISATGRGVFAAITAA